MSEQTEKMLILARRAIGNENYTDATRYYEQILMDEPNNWEAVFYYDLCAAATCVVRDIAPSATRIGKSFKNAFDIIDLSDIQNKQIILKQIAADARIVLLALRNGAREFLTGSYSDGSSEFCNRVRACGNAALMIGDCFYSIGEKTSAADFYTLAQDLYNGQARLPEMAISRIREVYPSFQGKKSGCYVATAVYGSYDCPQVWTLRRYRDNILAQNWFGRAFIRTYYAISPTLVKWFGETNWFKNMWRGKLDRMVKKLQENGVENTPYEDRNW